MAGNTPRFVAPGTTALLDLFPATVAVPVIVAVAVVRKLPDKSTERTTLFPSVHVGFTALACAGRTPSMVVSGAAVLLDSSPAIVTTAALVARCTFRAPLVFVNAVVPENREALTPGTLAAAGPVPNAVTAVAPRATPAT